MKRSARIALTIVAIAGAVNAVVAQAPRITGTITYRERVALSPDAVVEVRLEDVTRPEGTPPVVSRMHVEHPGQVPIRFELPYDSRLVNARGRYAVRATIQDRGVDLFTSLDTALVLTQGHGNAVALTLTRIGTPKAPSAEPPPARPEDKPAPTAVPVAKPLAPHPFAGFPLTFAGSVAGADGAVTRWHLNLFGDDSFFLRMTGPGASTQDDLGSWSLSTDRRTLTLRDSRDRLHAFQVAAPGTLRAVDADGNPRGTAAARDLYRAPAYRPLDLRARVRGSYTPDTDGRGATFVECSTGQRWFVAPEAAAADLTRAYTASKLGGSSILAEFDGSIVNRAGDTRPIPTVVVSAFGRLLPRQTCAPRYVAVPLTDTAWRLTHLGERAVPPNADARLNVTVTFQPSIGDAVGTFAGSSGCNRLIGMYAVNDAAMTLTPGGNLRACKEQVVSAETIVAALKMVRAYRISGAVLELVDETGRRVARFDSRPVQ
jgi:putative lipoprotein